MSTRCLRSTVRHAAASENPHEVRDRPIPLSIIGRKSLDMIQNKTRTRHSGTDAGRMERQSVRPSQKEGEILRAFRPK